MKKLFLIICIAAVGFACTKDNEADFALDIQVDDSEVITFGQTKTFDVVQSGVKSTNIEKPEGWAVSLDKSLLTVTAPSLSDNAAEDGTIKITATGNGESKSVEFNVAVYTLENLDFEEFDGTEYVADSEYGSNYYSGSSKVTFWSSECGLYSEINDGDYGQAFFSGGIAISQYNDMTTTGYTNQMSVYYQDATTGLGGHNGSKTFGVHYGNNNEEAEFDSRTTMVFDDTEKETVFQSMWVCNSTYAYLSMHDGDSFMGTPLNYADKDWFKLTVTGLDKSGKQTGEVEFFLADFRQSGSKGIITGWQEVDLTPLGRVNSLVFDMQGTHDNGYGTAIPVYFCMDDVTFRKY